MRAGVCVGVRLYDVCACVYDMRSVCVCMIVYDGLVDCELYS